MSSSRIAIKMNRSTDETKEALPGPVDDAASSSEDEVEEENEGDGPREETPDLYRNSSLGMYVSLLFHAFLTLTSLVSLGSVE